MSSKAKLLLKKLRNKSNEERKRVEQKRPETLNDAINRRIMKNNPFSKSVPKGEDDPLNFFDKEHLVIKPENMDKYKVQKEEIAKEVKEEEAKEKEEKEEKKENNPPRQMKIGGMMGVRMFQINMKEMMNARGKIKKKDDDAAIAYKKQQAEEEKKRIEKAKREEEQKRKEEEERRRKQERKKNVNTRQRFNIRLTLAKKQYNQRTLVSQNIYSQIISLAEELKSLNDMPKEMLDEIDEILGELEIPDRIISVDEVQDYVPEEQYEPIIKNPIPLEQVLKTINFDETN